ncbi:MAG: Gfo/Idh/MocA family oxidoreductase [Sedimentisphaerales bacterium]|nr:Gfo/Idh/MocA family oxidoreductase [Sedimentisphaerales bacterium]
MDKIRWGIIGCGNVTEVKSGPAFQKIKDSELVAVMRRNSDKAKDYAARHGVPKWYDDADKLINDPDVNAVYIATPPDTHAEYAIRVAQAGKPVYVEKPMARNYAECEKMIQACRDASVPLFVAYYRRCLPCFRKLKELIDSEAIGDVRFVFIELFHSPLADDFKKDNLPWRVIPEISGGGYFVDLASHELDLLDYILGPIDFAQGRIANQANLYPAEDIVCADFTFKSGVLGSGLWCFTTRKEDRLDRIRIVGSKGKITYSMFDSTLVTFETNGGIEKFDLPHPKHFQQPLIQTIIDELQGKGTCPSTGITAARTNYVMDQILKK